MPSTLYRLVPGPEIRALDKGRLSTVRRPPLRFITDLAIRTDKTSQTPQAVPAAPELAALFRRRGEESPMLQRFLVEMRKFALIALFLFLFFGAFATYRRLILRQYQID